MILIFPPVAKPGEPPAGIAKLAGMLKAEHLPCTIIDANIEGLHYLLTKKSNWEDTWYKRAIKHMSRHLQFLQSIQKYHTIHEYKHVVGAIKRILYASTAGQESAINGIHITLSDYKHPILCPTKSSDILQAAGTPETNPFYPYFSQRLTTIVEQTGDTIVGFSLFYLNQVLTTFAMIGFLRKRYPHLTIVAGGGLVTTWMNNPAWKNPFSGLVDEFIPGPGETKILSLYGKKSGTHNHYTPSYSLFPLDSYLSPPYILPYAASAGCCWKKCNFCPEKAENTTYVAIPPSRVLKDVEIMCKTRKPTLIHLLDNTINIPILKALAKNPPGSPWYGYTRISEELTDLDFCIALKKAGCVMLQLGIESGDQGVLEQMGKGFTLTLASRVLKALNAAHIAVYAYFLFGTPWETEKSAHNTLDFIRSHHDCITFINPAIFNMPVCDPGSTRYPTTGLHQGDLSLYRDFVHPHGWDRSKVRKFLHYQLKKNKLITTIVKATPPFFNANHAPFFYLQ